MRRKKKKKGFSGVDRGLRGGVWAGDMALRAGVISHRQVAAALPDLRYYYGVNRDAGNGIDQDDGRDWMRWWMAV